MKTVLAWIGGIAIVASVLFFGFNGWTKKKHDMSAIDYVQDEWGWFNNKNTEKTATEDEVVVENEDGTVEATASIKF